MSDKVYPNKAMRASGENRIDLSDADLNVLRNAIDQHVRQHNIKGLRSEIVYAVFRHTVCFNKRGDDMNGGRLQKLTGSRYDYCNNRVKILLENSVLIGREGHYGKILSINYDFDQWGKIPDDNDKPAMQPEEFLAKQPAPKPTNTATDLPKHPVIAVENSSAIIPNVMIKQPDNNLIQNSVAQLMPDDITRLISHEVISVIVTTVVSCLQNVLQSTQVSQPEKTAETAKTQPVLTKNTVEI